jgi:diacylglycerol kinase (ATP)
VINGAAREAGALQRVTFGVLPLGTGNDFIRALGFPDELEPALERLTARTPAQRLDLGSLNGRLFANASGGGFIAETSESVDPTLKTWAGRLAYLIGGAQVLMDFAPLAGWMHVQDRRRRFEASLFAVCNARTQGGGHLVAPYAWLDDGRLDLCMVAPMPAPELVGMLRSMSRGEHVEDERVVYVQAPWLRLEFDAPVRVNTDGEVLEARACEYRAVPGGARFLVDHPPFLLDGAPAQPIWRL